MADSHHKDQCQPWLLPRLPGETDVELQQRRNQAYFDEQRSDSCPEWWLRMDIDMPVDGLRVLDLGCGHGALSVHIAELGAAQVVGVDLDEERIEFAEENLERDFPQFRECIQFRCQDVADLDLDDHFDLIVTKDSFEHIEDLPGLVDDLHRMLKPGGILAAGFSPLFYSPFGDHARFELKVPWLHAILPDSLLVWWLNYRTSKNAANSMDLGLNRLTPRQFRDIFGDHAKWSQLGLQYNRGGRFLMPLFSFLRRIPLLERFFTVSIYAVVQKGA